MPIKYHLGFALALACSLMAACFSVFGVTSTAAKVGLIVGGLGMVINPILWRIAARRWTTK